MDESCPEHCTPRAFEDVIFIGDFSDQPMPTLIYVDNYEGLVNYSYYKYCKISKSDFYSISGILTQYFEIRINEQINAQNAKQLDFFIL